MMVCYTSNDGVLAACDGLLVLAFSCSTLLWVMIGQIDCRPNEHYGYSN